MITELWSLVRADWHTVIMFALELAHNPLTDSYRGGPSLSEGSSRPVAVTGIEEDRSNPMSITQVTPVRRVPQAQRRELVDATCRGDLVVTLDGRPAILVGYENNDATVVTNDGTVRIFVAWSHAWRVATQHEGRFHSGTECAEGGHVNDDNPGQPRCRTCADWL